MWKFLILALCVTSSSAGMVKRDTITDIKDSVGNILGVNKEESLLDYIEDEIDTQLDVDRNKYCIKDDNCVQFVQFCNTATIKLYGTCEFHTWFWIAVGVALSLTFGSCLCSLLCCLCKCK